MVKDLECHRKGEMLRSGGERLEDGEPGAQETD